MSQQEKAPQGWIEVSLGDVIELKYGKALPAKVRDGEHYPVYGSNGIVGYHSRPIVNGPALVVGRKGSIGEVHLSEKDCSPIDTTYFVDEFHGQPPSFWLHRLRCLNLADLNRATALPGLNRNDAYHLTLLLPPLKEQYRIVDKTDALQARSIKARKALETIPPLLDKFRQSVLSSAFRGDLTADWRAQNPDIDPAEILLERIRKERRKSWEEDELAKMKAKGKTPKDDKWKKKYQEPEPVDPSDLHELPEGWYWISLPECGEMSRGKSKHRPRNDKRLFGGKYPFIQTGEVARANGHIINATTFYSEFGLQQSRLFPAGTVCITIAANIAETAVLDIDACFPDSVVGVITDNQVISPDYLEFYIRTVRDDLSAFAPATAQKNINIAILNKVAVPIPPEKERKAIEQLLFQSLQYANNIENKCMGFLESLKKLDQSILAKAFRGELVPQDPNDEPALELLKRIKKERESMVAQGKTQKKRMVKKKPIKIPGKTNPLEELILREFPKDEFAFDDLSNKIAMQYDELKKAIFLLLEEGAELTHGKKLAMLFDNHTEGMHFKVRKS